MIEGMSELLLTFDAHQHDRRLLSDSPEGLIKFRHLQQHTYICIPSTNQSKMLFMKKTLVMGDGIAHPKKAYFPMHWDS